MHRLSTGPPLQIFAAGSLRPAFERLVAASTQPLLMTYANARDLAHRICAGEHADVFASASAEHPRQLHRRRLVDEPRAFATNRLVVAVAQASPARDVRVLAAPGTRLVIEVQGIPAAAAVAATYVACVTTAARDRELATAWVDGLTEAPARAIMRVAGFVPRP